MKTIIYFIRHGEVYNPKKILYGRLPGFKLSKLGIETIKEVAKKFKKRGIQYIYASPMLRTRQTAEILGKSLGIKYKISSLINEVNLIFAGMPTDVFKRDIQKDLYSKKYISLGQESVEEIGERMLKFVQYIKKRHPGEKILVVSHGDPIQILRAITSNIKFTWEYKYDNYLQTGDWYTLVSENNHYSWR